MASEAAIKAYLEDDYQSNDESSRENSPAPIIKEKKVQNVDEDPLSALLQKGGAKIDNKKDNVAFRSFIKQNGCIVEKHEKVEQTYYNDDPRSYFQTRQQPKPQGKVVARAVAQSEITKMKQQRNYERIVSEMKLEEERLEQRRQEDARLKDLIDQQKINDAIISDENSSNKIDEVTAYNKEAKVFIAPKYSKKSTVSKKKGKPQPPKPVLDETKLSAYRELTAGLVKQAEIQKKEESKVEYTHPLFGIFAGGRDFGPETWWTQEKSKKKGKK